MKETRKESDCWGETEGETTAVEEEEDVRDEVQMKNEMIARVLYGRWLGDLRERWEGEV